MTFQQIWRGNCMLMRFSAMILLPFCLASCRELKNNAARSYLIGVLGPPVHDCGYVPLGKPVEVANSCALSNFEKGTPFVVTYETPSKDSTVIYGLAGTSTRDIITAKYDTERWDADEIKTEDRLDMNGHVLVHRCKPGSLLRLGERGRLECTP